MGRVRTHVANALRDKGVLQAQQQSGKSKQQQQEYHFLWVVDFPLFGTTAPAVGEPGLPSSSALESTHHPFTAPHPEDEANLFVDPLSVRGQHYDL